MIGLVLLPGLGGRGAPAGPAEIGSDSRAETELLGRVRQLTFDGRRAGEGYFSPDGSRMTFQSEREPGNPFFQIYEMDLRNGETRRISPGMGKTTCAFYRPGSPEILFASTHHDPRSKELQEAELQFRATGKQRRYDWDFDPEMELYVTGASVGELRRLTDSQGYDAEGSYSPDGEWIVFTSTRHAYAATLSTEQRQNLESDPSFHAEIYLMKADGSGLRRLSDAPGYDGGPFFSPDGKRIIWRRFESQGTIADLWSMKLDGSDVVRITEFASMSWAPYSHPSGEYIFFTSNRLGMSNFELFIVDRDGRKEPVRVTYTEGFDGLPVPSPDGKHLSWTSNRRGGGGQIFIADWNHERALALLRAAPPRETHAGGSERP